MSAVPDLVGFASPGSHAKPGMPPFLIQHGTRDATVPVQQSIVLATRSRQALGGDTVMLDLVEGAEHLDPKSLARENVGTVLQFLDACLKAP